MLAHAFHSDTGLTKVESMGEHRKIRFAPLPEITGRDGDWDVGGLEDEDGSELTRTQSAGLSYERGHLDAEMDDEEDDQDDRERGRGSLFGSWKSDTSFGGRRSGTDDDEGGGSSSYTSKLLRPLSFGLGSKKKRSSSKSRGATSGSDSLSRQSSNESDISRGSSMDGGGFRPTGIPMRKTRTWESGDSGGPRESRRAQYPPVAQRSRTARRPVSISAPDPTFNEWGAGSSVGSVASRGSAKVEEDEDDGGGMAWIKKRRAQREAERKKAEEEEAERKRKEEEEEERKGAEGEGGEEDVPFAIDDAGGEEGEDGEGDRTMEQQTPSGEATPAQQVVKDVTAASAHLSSSSASTPTISTTPKAQQHSLLGMTRPSLNVVTSSPGPSSPALGSGSKSFDHTSSVAVDSPVAIDTPPREATPVAVGHDDGHAQRLSDKLGKLAIGGRSTIHKGPVSPVEYESDEEDSDEDDDEDQDDDDGSDLDDEELQEEERLAEEARRTAKSAGARAFPSSLYSGTLADLTRSLILQAPSASTQPRTSPRSSKWKVAVRTPLHGRVPSRNPPDHPHSCPLLVNQRCSHPVHLALSTPF